jgi:hypothetical protein
MMNLPTDSSLPIDDATLSRLVDDELAVTERRRVIESLEHDPSGWRRCSLAFLEDQAFRREIRRYASSQGGGDAPDRCPPSVTKANRAAPAADRKPAGRSDLRFSWQTLWATAATLLAAVALTQLIRTDRSETPAPSTVALQQETPETQPKIPPSDQPPETVVVADWNFWERDSAIPPNVRQALKKLGTEVRQERGIVPVRLPDGRRVAVPYENVQFVPVGDTSY